MKKVILFICLVTTKVGYTQTVFSYAKNKVDKNEFLNAFHRNNPTGYSDQAISAYLDLYINFKVKVKAARDMGLDTSSAQQSDLQNFRQQIAAHFLSEDSSIHQLCKEAFARSQKDIRLGHIFVPFRQGINFSNPSTGNPSSPADTIAALQVIQQAYRSLQQGNAFAAVAQQFSKDPEVSKNHGDVGFITVMVLPYPVENIVYNLGVGSYSEPYRSNAGYHIFYNLEERPSLGKMKAAQILFPFSPGLTDTEKKLLRHKADSVYNQLRQGGDWNILATQFSLSNNPASANGAIPDITVGRYDPVFENAVWSLKENGAITPPFETNYGIHLVKRIEHIPANHDSSQAIALFKTAVLQDERLDLVRTQQTQRILQQSGYKRLIDDSILWQATDSLLQNENYLPSKNLSATTGIFSFTKKTVSVADWWQYIQTVKNNYRAGVELPYEMIMERYVSGQALQYYQDHLEDFNEAFKVQLQEFEEGNLLFDVMEKQIWNKASADEKGLQQYYQANKAKYQWEPGVTAIYFSAQDKEMADQLLKDYKTFVSNWRNASDVTAGKLIADSARFEWSQLPGLTTQEKEGTLSVLLSESDDNGINLVFITALHPHRQQKTFEEARGLVINDYQTVLEEKWVKELRKKYKVKVNQKTVQELH